MVGHHDAGARATVHSWINGGFGAVPSRQRDDQTAAKLKAAGVGAWIAPTTGDLHTAALALAEQLVGDQVDVLLIDANAADPIACLVAAWGVARKTVWIGRRTAFLDASVDAAVYYNADAAAVDRSYWTGRGVEPIVACEGVDLHAASLEPARREQYGIPAAAVICTTAADDLPATISDAMVDAAIALLRREPSAVYLLVGGGDTGNLRRRFDAAGVGRRVGYAGRRRDLASFLPMADLYLCPFATSGDDGATDAGETLTAMSAGLATLALGTAGGGHGHAGADATADDLDAWADRASRLVRDGATRRRTGQSMRRRVEQHFSYASTAAQLRSLVGFLLHGGEAPAAVRKAA